MAIKSATFAAKVANHVTGRATFTPPSKVAFALLTALPATNADAPVELAAAGYSRASLENGESLWGAASTNGASTNAVLISFGTAGATWAGIVGWGMYNEETGELMYYGPLSAAVSAVTGETASFQPGALEFIEE